jgi:hypothetical protein
MAPGRWPQIVRRAASHNTEKTEKAEKHNRKHRKKT